MLCVASLAGCRSTKGGTGQGSIVTDLPLKERYESVVSGYGGWTDVSVPVSVEIDAPARFSISGRIKMVRGKSVDVSLRMLGFEVGRIYATSDSVYGMIKPSKVYMAESLKEIFPGMPFTIGNLQELLLGRMFIMGKPSLTVRDYGKFELQTAMDGWGAFPKNRPDMLQYAFGFTSGNVMACMELGVVKSGGDAVLARGDYASPYSEGKRGCFPGDFSIVCSKGDKTVVDGSLTWKWRSASWDEGNIPVWSVPKGYRRVKGADLMKNLK